MSAKKSYAGGAAGIVTVAAIAFFFGCLAATLWLTPWIVRAVQP
jgi:hypothetical protein